MSIIESDIAILTKWICKIPCNHIVAVASDWYTVTDRNREILKNIKIERLTIEYDKKGELFRAVITI